MSLWKLVTRELYAAGRPLKRVEFEHGPTGTDPHKGLRDAKRIGLVTVAGSKADWYWSLTEYGKAWAEGRCEVHIPSFKRHRNGRAPGSHYRLRATWLAALPRANEIRITA